MYYSLHLGGPLFGPLLHILLLLLLPAFLLPLVQLLRPPRENIESGRFVRQQDHYIFLCAHARQSANIVHASNGVFKEGDLAIENGLGATWVRGGGGRWDGEVCLLAVGDVSSEKNVWKVS